MATITSATTISKQDRGGYVRYKFRFVLDNGETHIRNAWVLSSVEELAEIQSRGAMLLLELAEAEADEVLNG